MRATNTAMTRRRFGITAALTAVGTATLPASFTRLAHATSNNVSIKNATLVTLRAPAGATHTLVTTNDGRVTIQILEGPDGLILIDSGEAPDYAASAVEFAQSLGKPVAAVMLSHDHPDHTGGLPAYAGLPIMTTTGILNNIKNGPFPKPSNIGDIDSLDDTSVSIAGLNLRIHNIKDAEAAEQIVIEAPELKTAVVQDLVYNNCYMFPGMNRPNWMEALSDLQARLEVDNLLVGHGYPSSRGELSSAIDYLSDYQLLISESADGKELAEKVKRKWPNHMGEGLLALQGFAFKG
jgi:glyoxylase-like metal-dependent hydrolase (beta-lactamase superfamily II)